MAPDDNPNILDLTDELDEPTEPQPDDQAEPEDDAEDDEQAVVAFEGEDPEPEAENSTVRSMRQALREKDKRIKELEQSTAPKPVELGPKPTLADFDYDEEKYDAARDAWQERKDTAARQQETQAEQSRKANQEWQHDLSAFEQKKGALQFDDRDDVIDAATSSLDMVQQAVVVKSANDPALFLYALGKSEAKRAELAQIQDPIKLAAAVARMEGAVKVTKGRKPPEPDRPLRGSAPMPGGADKTHANLSKEAERTGDFTKLIAYEKEQAAAKK